MALDCGLRAAQQVAPSSFVGPFVGWRRSSVSSPVPTAWSSPNEKPDRYAAATCIRVRPHCLLRGYSLGESCQLSVVRRAQRTPDAIRMLWGFRRTVTSFSSWLSSLPSLPSSLSWPCCPPWSQKLIRCKSTIDMHTFRVHHNCKIDTPRFEEGKRPPHRRDLRLDKALAWGVDTARPYDRCSDRVSNRDQCSAGTMRRARWRPRLSFTRPREDPREQGASLHSKFWRSRPSKRAAPESKA